MSKSVLRATVRGNIVWLLIERGWRVLLGLGVNLLVTRYLGPTEFGMLSYALSLSAIFAAVAGLGVDDVLSRELVRHPLQARALMGLCARIKLVGAGVSFVLVLIAGLLWMPHDKAALGMLACVSAGFFFAPAEVIDLWYQSREHMRSPALARQLAFAVSAVTKIALVAVGAPVWMFAIAAAFDVVLVAVALGLLWCFRGGRAETRQDNQPTDFTVLKFIREGAPLLLSGFLVMVTMQSDRLLLIRQVGDVAAGVYSAAARMTELFYILPMAVGTAFLPRLSALHFNDDKTYAVTARRAAIYLIIITTCIASAVSIMAPVVIPVFLGEAYERTAGIWAVHVWSLVFVGIVSLRSRLLVIEGKTRWILWMSLATTAVNIMVNLCLIPIMGGKGAAWAAVVAWGISALLLPWFNRDTAAFMRRWMGLRFTA